MRRRKYRKGKQRRITTIIEDVIRKMRNRRNTKIKSRRKMLSVVEHWLSQ